jgi:uncharacterized protein YcbK (DUF882 family)
MKHLSRRRVIAAFAAAVPALVLPRWATAAERGGPRTISFSHLHTGERLTAEYFTNGEYVPDALAAVNRVLRDFRTGDVHEIDPGLLNLLHGLADLTSIRRPFEVISGYRSPKTNEMLRSHGEGVAAGSLHMQGQAIDIRLADVPLARLREAALSVRRGGVGYYPASNFIHVDTGRVRSW